MSGIYGVWQPWASIADYGKDIEKLQSWNKAYGKRSEKVNAGKMLCLGCCCEKLMDTAPVSPPVLKTDGKYAVIDALLYNRDEA